MIQADVTKEMAFKEGGEVGNMGPKKLILILGVQSNGARASDVSELNDWVRELHKGSCLRVCRNWVIV